MEAKKPNTKLISLGVLIAVVLLVVAVTALNKKDKDDTLPATDSVAQVQAESTTSDATATSQETATTDATTPAAATQPTSTPTTTPTATAAYKAGTYTASGSYVTPESNETIKVSLTLDSDGTITAATVSQTPQDRESEEYQQRFASNYKASVVGKNISTLKLGNISGSSLTPIGFNKASASIESTAKA